MERRYVFDMPTGYDEAVKSDQRSRAEKGTSLGPGSVGPSIAGLRKSRNRIRSFEK